eukprot:TRINITY_DN14480_c0_g1_i1.p1 TRINITY_DN14480_c0_g1~~TRINITY_DN14480_c0_g1_i1.p1  ORF type:complete len:419 (-),score=62.13 TRINITY_DN14480_c0_g1_i1:44-1129(-)
MCSILVDQLKASGKAPEDCPLVVGIVRNHVSPISSGYLNLTEGHPLSLDRRFFRLCYTDLSVKLGVDSIIKGPVKMIYHLAAKGGDWGYQKSFIDSNIQGTRNVVDAAVRVHKTSPFFERLVHVSTVDIYPPHVPTDHCVEDIYIRKDRRHYYSVTKAKGERIALKAHRDHGVPVTLTRPAAVFGPRSWSFGYEEGKIIWDGRDEGFNGVYINGARHSMGGIYIDDCIDHMIEASKSPNTIGKIYNASVYHNVQWRDYYCELADGLEVRRPTLSIPQWFSKIVAFAFETVYHYAGWGLTQVEDCRPLITLFLLGLVGRPQLWPMEASVRDFGWRPKWSFAAAMARVHSWNKRQFLEQDGLL